MPKDLFADIFDHRNPPHYKYFDGESWSTSLSGKLTEIISPVDGQIVGKVQQVTFAEIDRCLDRVKTAQKEWAQVPMTRRTQVLHLAADWMREHEYFLATLLMAEIGKSYAESRDEIMRSADMIEYFSHEALHLSGEQLSGDVFPGYDQTKTALVTRVPLGVIVAISPFNYPINLAVSKIAPALIAGNGVIFKPPENGSIISLYLTKIFLTAGLPKGLLATVTGSGRILGDYLVTHPEIDLVAFTGSSEVGQSIAQKAGMIPLLLECGGNNPALVLPDADFENTAEEIVKGAFSFSGQRCTAIKYVLCLSGTDEKLIPRVLKKSKSLFKMGDIRIEANNFGPLISDEAAHKIEKAILIAKAEGAKVVLGGKREGRYIEPTVIIDAKPHMEIIHSEMFGPILSFITVKSVDEAVNIINSSKYGLQASIFTSDEGTGIRLAGNIETGSVLINSKPQRGPDHFPFVGIKASGLGVQGIKYTLEAMTRLKPVILNKPH